MFAKITERSLSPLLVTALAAIFVVSPAQAADPIVTNPSSIVDGSAGLNHAVVVTTDGSVYAWGMSYVTGTGPSEYNVSEATQVQGLVGIKQVSASESHTLALDGSGAVWGWGNSSYYQLGRPTIGYQVDKPIKITTLPLMRKVYAAKYRGYGIDRQNNLWTWGLPSGQQYAAETGTLPRMILTSVEAIFPAEYQTLIVKKDGTLWGYGSSVFYGSRESGAEDYIDVYTPVQFDIANVKQVIGKWGYVAALTDEGLVYEWGSSNCMAQPAGSYPSYVSDPTLVEGLDNVTELYGTVTGCAAYVKKADNTFWAWGDPTNLPIADASGVSQITTPVQILAGQNVQKLFTGYMNGFAVTPDKFIGWGSDRNEILYFQNN